MLLHEKNYGKILEKIIQSDDVIRFASICDKFGKIEEKLQRDHESLLNEYDTDKLVKAGVNSWHYRKQLSSKIGEGHYAMVVYDKITRLTFPLDDHFLLITIDNLVETPKIVDTIKKILKE